MADIIELSPEERQSAKKTLYKIRFSLVVEKIKGPTITRGNFKKIVDDAKEELKDEKVKKALDKFFDEYLPTKGKNNNVINLTENNTEQPSYQEEGMNKGRSYVKKPKNNSSAWENSNISEAA